MSSDSTVPKICIAALLERPVLFVGRKDLLSDVKLSGLQTLSSLKESDLALAHLRTCGKPRYESLDAYFAAMGC